MGMISYTFQIFNTLPQEVEESKVELVIWLDGTEEVSIEQGSITFHNCSLGVIVTKSNTWQKYFRIEEDNEKKAVTIFALKYGTFKYRKSWD